ncbi:thyrotropin-releasing hormone receptor [Plakobranchus ocellatus]|uniref:Thyrotropin-releasing hormone receptor n=1 Tax=Plakobranchus ocellatus TaxID=259542 RepID=A0AAV3ZE03_9GAST|nr:thyrotropin-releasing hormone receptor [Plakobranchus ocellatus]
MRSSANQNTAVAARCLPIPSNAGNALADNYINGRRGMIMCRRSIVKKIDVWLQRHLVRNTERLKTMEDTVTAMEEIATQVFNSWIGTTDPMTEGEEVNETLLHTTALTTTTSSTTTKKPCYVWEVPPCDAWIQAAYDFAVYGVYVSYAIGIPGSILTLVILARMRPFNSSSFWLTCLASVDLIGLTVRLILSIYLLYNYRWVDWWCRLYYVLTRGTKHISFYCLVGLTVERFIAVWFPLKMSQWCTIRRAMISFLVICVVIISSDLHFIKTKRVSGDFKCIIRKKYRPFWQNTYEKYIQMTFFQTLPMVALITLNILIALRLRSQRKIQREMSDKKSKDRDKQQKQIDRMLLAATVVFCVFVLPQIIFQYTEMTWASVGSLGTDFYRERARHILVMTCNTLNVFNHAVNFLLYVFVAQKFRAEIIRLFTCGRFTGFGQRANAVQK